MLYGETLVNVDDLNIVHSIKQQSLNIIDDQMISETNHIFCSY